MKFSILFETTQVSRPSCFQRIVVFLSGDVAGRPSQFVRSCTCPKLQPGTGWRTGGLVKSKIIVLPQNEKHERINLGKLPRVWL